MTPTVSRKLAERLEKHENFAARAARKQERKPMEPKITEGRQGDGFYREETTDRWTIHIKMDSYGVMTNADLVVDGVYRADVYQVRAKDGRFVYEFAPLTGRHLDGSARRYVSQGSVGSALRRRAAALTKDVQS
jgi:hypothetical protein